AKLRVAANHFFCHTSRGPEYGGRRRITGATSSRSAPTSPPTREKIMRKAMCLAALALACSGLFSAVAEAGYYRQYYSSWSYYSASNYHYSRYYYYPTTYATTYSYHYVIYYPSQPRYYYYYNPSSGTYWGRYDLQEKGYSLLAEK